MQKIDRRDEMADLDDDATDGQISDYLAAELSGDNGAWNLGVVEYLCPKCDLIVQILNDELPNYYPLIRAWHERAAEGDCFARFVFEYLSFIAHIKYNIFYDASSDRNAIQRLKQDQRIGYNYLEKIKEEPELSEAWNKIIEELKEIPLHNSSIDSDNPEIDKWWNTSEYTPNGEDDQPKGRVSSLDDWQNMVEFWYGVRNNLFHGGKNPNMKRDIFLVEHAFITLRPLMDSEVKSISS